MKILFIQVNNVEALTHNNKKRLMPEHQPLVYYLNSIHRNYLRDKA